MPLPAAGRSPYKTRNPRRTLRGFMPLPPDPSMPMSSLRLLMLAALTTFALAGCAQFERKQDPAVTANSAQEDDAYCRREAGEPGSARYGECLKIREQKRQAFSGRIERTHRNLSERMLDGR